MNRVFKNIQDQEQFEWNGHVRVPVLDAETCGQLLAYYNTLKEKVDVKNSVYGIYVSLDDKNKTVKQETMSFIQETIQPKLDRFLENYNVHLGGFIIKQSDSVSYTYPHQDWTFVDHTDADSFSATIWISLEDVTPDAGSLGFVNGSHRYLDGIVGSPSSVFINPTQGHESTLFEYLSFPEVKAGDALIFNNKCAHGANPNLSGKDRVIVGIGITPKQSSLYHYFLRPGTTDKVLKLKVAEDFFLNYMNDDLIETYMKGSIPEHCEVVDEFEFVNKSLTRSEMLTVLTENGCVKNEYSIKRPEVQQQESVHAEESVTWIEPVSPSSQKEVNFFKIYTPMNIYREAKYRLGNFFRIYTPYNVYKESKYRLTGKY